MGIEDLRQSDLVALPKSGMFSPPPNREAMPILFRAGTYIISGRSESRLKEAWRTRARMTRVGEGWIMIHPRWHPGAVAATDAPRR